MRFCHPRGSERTSFAMPLLQFEMRWIPGMASEPVSNVRTSVTPVTGIRRGDLPWQARGRVRVAECPRYQPLAW